jgi:hypothetical protein
VSSDIVGRLQQVARANGCEAGRGCSEAAAEIERLRAVLDVVDAQVAAYMNGSIGSSRAIQTISLLLDAEEARRG